MLLDIARLLHDFKIDATNERNGWINVRCPLCDDDDYHGGFNITNNYYNCYKCGGHHINTVIRALLGITKFAANDLIERYSTVISSTRIITKRNDIHSSLITLPITTLDNRGKKYLLSRGFDPDFLFKKYHICGMTYTGEWAFRIIIPIYYHSKLISFQGRSIFSKNKCKQMKILRYKTLSSAKSVLDPKSILYNLDNCTNEHLILTEGAPDVWALGDDCAATLGTSMTESQLALIKSRFTKVIFLFDPEPEAQKRAEKQAMQLAAIGIKNIEVIDTQLQTDPGDMDKKAIKKLKKELIG